MDNEIFKRRRKEIIEGERTQRLKKDDIKKKSIPKICCNCNSIYEIKIWEIDDGKPTGISHGFCPKCYEKLRDKIESES